MKKINTTRLLLAAAVALSTLGQPAFAVEVGTQAPPFTLDGSGGTASLDAQAGKVVYVDFWASWCGPCRQSFPWLNEMQKAYGSKGFVVIGVNVDRKREDADKFLADTPARFALGYDPQGKTPREWKVMGMPSSYLIGRDGKVRLVHQGFRDSDRAELEAKIKEALGDGK